MLSTVVALLLVAFEPAEVPAEKSAETPAQTAEPAQAAEKICRYIRKDASSRRKDKVCLTAEQWKQQNQGE
ncbi:hypothetical protein LY632_09130 [Erythrobacter sp. SDW2]|uniref:hypothetical protein n=1 Tax=Erythrobacter sp. SDW2 TaxID=2907154 RepID=UPI001F47303E|nr:hypothetical protein [Erythrobacter sp. SDW2]UIP05869.1 hypothetical protein LY632_09130 [Erythrobacter sp. SDW2]